MYFAPLYSRINTFGFLMISETPCVTYKDIEEYIWKLFNGATVSHVYGSHSRLQSFYTAGLTMTVDDF